MLVFVKDVQRPRLERRRPAARAARTVLPHAELVAGFNTPPNVCRIGLIVVDKNLPAFTRRCGLRPRSQPLWRGQKFIDRLPGLTGRHSPHALRHRVYFTADSTTLCLVRHVSCKL